MSAQNGWRNAIGRKDRVLLLGCENTAGWENRWKVGGSPRGDEKDGGGGEKKENVVARGEGRRRKTGREGGGAGGRREKIELPHEEWVYQTRLGQRRGTGNLQLNILRCDRTGCKSA